MYVCGSEARKRLFAYMEGNKVEEIRIDLLILKLIAGGVHYTLRGTFWSSVA